MNWYKLFYLISIADGIKNTLLGIAITGTALGAIGILIYTLANQFDADKSIVISTKAISGRTLKWLIPVTIFCWLVSSLVPSKQDGLMILAGGAVGTYIAGDSSIKALPKEATELLRERIKAEIKDLRSGSVADTLKEKSKEELIKMVQDLKKN